MAYDILESSNELGRPAEFYSFMLGPNTWRYTTADVDVIAGGFTWTAAAIKSDSVKFTGETSNDAFSLDVPSWIAPAQIHMASAPSTPITMTQYTKHHGDSEMLVSYIGEVSQVGFPMPGRAKIICLNTSGSLNREGLRLSWQRTCAYALYDPLTCKVDKATWQQALVVLQINGAVVNIELAGTLRDTDFFNNGFMVWTHPMRGNEYLAIERSVKVAPAVNSVNTQLLLQGDPGELFEGATGFVLPGCNFTPTNCQAFANYDNYGGAPDLPGRSPFDGQPVF